MPSRPFTGLSVVVPLYRDEATVEALVADALANLPALGVPFELVLVDDASPDASGARARELAARVPCVRALHHPRNRGLGGALSTGILAARHDHVLYTDGDHTYPLAQVGPFVTALAEADVVVGPPAGRPCGGPTARHERVVPADARALRARAARRELLVQALPDRAARRRPTGRAPRVRRRRAAAQGARPRPAHHGAAGRARRDPGAHLHFLSARLIGASVAEALRARAQLPGDRRSSRRGR
ncbi:MAG: glycosyltransferase family 2 protein [Deltaproteobacteria bacterium]|nr:glycosyltransferase family 2 protein [Deltaproteobacteria bacterium]